MTPVSADDRFEQIKRRLRSLKQGRALTKDEIHGAAMRACMNRAARRRQLGERGAGHLLPSSTFKRVPRGRR